MKRLIKKSCILGCMFLGTVFFSCSNGTNPDSSLTTAQDENTDTPGHDSPEQPQTVDLSELLSSLSDDEIAVLVESVNTQILSTENGVTGITLLIDGDKNLVLNYADEAEIKLTPPLTEDGAIKLLEAYADKNTVINAKKTELKNTADSLSLSSVIKTSLKTMIENIPPEKFAYDLGSRAIYLKMSDLDSSILPAATEDGATVIPGVKRIKKNGRTALDFTGDASQKVLVDCSPNAVVDGDNGEVYYTDFSKYYRGGILYKDADISLTNDTGIFVYKSNKGDFSTEDSRSSVLDIFKAKDARFSKLTLQSSDKNLYGVIDEELYQKYYDRISLAGEYDAKEALGEETMFNDTLDGYNTNAHPIDVNFAEYLLNRRVDIKNVVVSGSLPTGEDLEQPFGTLINAVVKSDMSRFKGLNVKGIVRFNGKSPKSLLANGTASYSKVIFDNADAWNDTLQLSQDYAPVLDVSKLGPKQDSIYEKIPRGYYSGDKSFTRSLQASMMFGTKYYKSTNEDYSDLLRETYGNTNVEPKDTDLIQRIKLKDDAQVPLSRANNIKLTPIQKLLLDDQHIYG